MNNYFLNITKGIITESINVTKASEAIRKRNEVKITYDGDGGGERIIQPVAYGLSKAGNLVLRAFQPYGTTKTKVPHWKMFRLDKIDSWKPLRDKIFNEPPGQFSAEGSFNPNGDNSMSEVYLVANFERSKDYHSGKRYGGLKQYNDQRQANKTNEDPFYKFKKNLKNSYITKDVKDRVDKEKSQGANDYVNGNDRYQKDMFKLTNIPTRGEVETEPITKEPIISKQEKSVQEPININDNNETEINSINKEDGQ